MAGIQQELSNESVTETTKAVEAVDMHVLGTSSVPAEEATTVTIVTGPRSLDSGLSSPQPDITNVTAAFTPNRTLTICIVFGPGQAPRRESVIPSSGVGILHLYDGAPVEPPIEGRMTSVVRIRTGEGLCLRCRTIFSCSFLFGISRR